RSTLSPSNPSATLNSLVFTPWLGRRTPLATSSIFNYPSESGRSAYLVSPSLSQKGFVATAVDSRGLNSSTTTDEVAPSTSRTEFYAAHSSVAIRVQPAAAAARELLSIADCLLPLVTRHN